MSNEQLKPTARQLAGKLIEPLTEKLHWYFPNLTPNQVTTAGLFGVSTALALNHYAQSDNQPQLKKAAFILYLFSSLLDGVDGSLARHINNNGGNHDTKTGQIVDVVADRSAETISSVQRIIYGTKKNNNLAVISAAFAGLTNTLPSLNRAKAEAKGKPVSETGKDLLSFFGTRTGRVITSSASSFFPEINGHNIQIPLDLLSTLANTVSAKQRKKISDNPNIPSSLSQDKIKDACQREKVLKLVNAVGMTTVAMITVCSLLKKSNTSTNN